MEREPSINFLASPSLTVRVPWNPGFDFWLLFLNLWFDLTNVLSTNYVIIGLFLVRFYSLLLIILLICTLADSWWFVSFFLYFFTKERAFFCFFFSGCNYGIAVKDITQLCSGMKQPTIPTVWSLKNIPNHRSYHRSAYIPLPYTHSIILFFKRSSLRHCFSHCVSNVFCSRQHVVCSHDVTHQLFDCFGIS